VKHELMHRIKFGSLLAILMAISPALADPAAGTVDGNPHPAPIGVVSSNVGVCDPSNPKNCWQPGAQYPAGATPLQASATGTTGAVTASLPAAAGKTTYVCGFDISAAGTGSIGPVATSGLVHNFTYQLTAPGTVSRTFQPCLPGSAANTAISLATTADGTATAVDVNLFGFQF